MKTEEYVASSINEIRKNLEHNCRVREESVKIRMRLAVAVSRNSNHKTHLFFKTIIQREVLLHFAPTLHINSPVDAPGFSICLSTYVCPQTNY